MPFDALGSVAEAASYAFNMASAVKAAPGGATLGVLAEGTVDEELEDASKYPVPSGKRPGCKGVGEGL